MPCFLLVPGVDFVARIQQKLPTLSVSLVNQAIKENLKGINGNFRREKMRGYAFHAHGVDPSW